jgi:hypothetical protein
MNEFIGVQTETLVSTSHRFVIRNVPIVWCISCAEEKFGDDVVAMIAKTGKQGTFFKAIYVGSAEHDSRSCRGCNTPMNEGNPR